MSSLVVVITFARITSADGRGAMVAVPWKEEGEVPAWSDGGGGTETVQDEKSTPKNHPPKIQTARNYILSCKRENYTETLGRGMWTI